MSIPKPFTDKSIRAEVLRLIRLHPRDQVGEAIVRYIGENFTPRLSPIKRENMLYHHDLVIGIVCTHFKMPLQQLVTMSRKTEYAHGRHILFYMLYSKSTLTLKAIGAMFDRDHTTIIHARDKVISRYTKDPTLRADIDAILKMFPKQDNQTATL